MQMHCVNDFYKFFINIDAKASKFFINIHKNIQF